MKFVETLIGNLTVVLVLSGCVEETTPYESGLSSNTPCVPLSEYTGVVRTALEQFLEDLSGKGKKPHEIDLHGQASDRFATAQSDLAHCVNEAYIRNDTTNLETLQDLELSVIRANYVAITYSALNKPWESGDLELYLQALKGMEVEPDLSWVDDTPCPEEEGE